jgi:hypothetical protein
MAQVEVDLDQEVVEASASEVAVDLEVLEVRISNFMKNHLKKSEVFI